MLVWASESLLGGEHICCILRAQSCLLLQGTACSFTTQLCRQGGHSPLLAKLPAKHIQPGKTTQARPQRSGYNGPRTSTAARPAVANKQRADWPRLAWESARTLPPDLGWVGGGDFAPERYLELKAWEGLRGVPAMWSERTTTVLDASHIVSGRRESINITAKQPRGGTRVLVTPLAAPEGRPAGYVKYWRGTGVTHVTPVPSGWRDVGGGPCVGLDRCPRDATGAAGGRLSWLAFSVQPRPERHEAALRAQLLELGAGCAVTAQNTKRPGQLAQGGLYAQMGMHGAVYQHRPGYYAPRSWAGKVRRDSALPSRSALCPPARSASS